MGELAPVASAPAPGSGIGALFLHEPGQPFRHGLLHEDAVLFPPHPPGPHGVGNPAPDLVVDGSSPAFPRVHGVPLRNLTAGLLHHRIRRLPTAEEGHVLRGPRRVGVLLQPPGVLQSESVPSRQGLRHPLEPGERRAGLEVEGRIVARGMDVVVRGGDPSPLRVQLRGQVVPEPVPLVLAVSGHR